MSKGTKEVISQTSGLSVEEKPTLRLIHNMARSGSTLMCKCLGCMQGINLLSEIHPLAVQLREDHPLSQAHTWFNLFTTDDIQRIMLQGYSFPFDEAIQLIEVRSREHGETLIIRDWAHLDFIGFPYQIQPSYTLRLAEVLKPHFNLIQTATVRHPVDQWLSMSKLVIMEEPIATGQLTIRAFLQGYLEFARHCQKIRFFRYEDFTRQPIQIMESMCESLDVPFDPSFIKHWYKYTTITGDVSSTRGGNEIKTLKRREFAPELLAAFEHEPAYAQALAMLGYST